MSRGFVPPKVTDTRTTQNEALHRVEEKTVTGTRRIVATFVKNFCDIVTPMRILGVGKEGLGSRRVHEEYEKENAPKTAKCTCKPTKKTVEKSTKKSVKKPTHKTTKKAAKKAVKKTTKEAAKKITKKAAD